MLENSSLKTYATDTCTLSDHSKMRLVLTWFNSHRTVDSFHLTFDGPACSKQYSMRVALGVLDLDLPDDSGKYELRDIGQLGAFDEVVLTFLTPPPEVPPPTIASLLCTPPMP